MAGFLCMILFTPLLSLSPAPTPPAMAKLPAIRKKGGYGSAPLTAKDRGTRCPPPPSVCKEALWCEIGMRAESVGVCWCVSLMDRSFFGGEHFAQFFLPTLRQSIPPFWLLAALPVFATSFIYPSPIWGNCAVLFPNTLFSFFLVVLADPYIWSLLNRSLTSYPNKRHRLRTCQGPQHSTSLP